MRVLETIAPPIINVPQDNTVAGVCAWSLDGKYFAWSCGDSLIQLICVPSLFSTSDKPFIWSPIKTIDAGHVVWSIAFGHQTKKMKQNFENKNHRRYLYHVFDDVLATGHSNGRIKAWDIETGSLKLELMDHRVTDHRVMVKDLHFAPENVFMMVSGCNNGTMKVWDFNDDGNMCKTIMTSLANIYTCRWSPDASLIAAAGVPFHVCLWSSKDYQLIRRLYGHQHQVSKCDFSPDGTMLASSSFDTRVIVWNVETGDMIAKFLHLIPEPTMMYAGGANGSHMTSVSFCPDNLSLISICITGMVYHWSLDNQEQPIDKIYVECAYDCAVQRSGQHASIGTMAGRVVMVRPAILTPTLKQMCRSKIRNCGHMKELLDFNVLPKSIRNYLMFLPDQCCD